MKNLVKILLLTFLCLLLAACGNEFAKLEYNSEEMLVQADHFAKSFSASSQKDNELSFSIGKFDGRETIWENQLPEAQELTIEFTFTLSGGQAKIVHIDPNDKVTTVIERSSEASADETTRIVLPMPQGQNRFKLVGYDCEDIELKLVIQP